MSRTLVYNPLFLKTFSLKMVTKIEVYKETTATASFVVSLAFYRVETLIKRVPFTRSVVCFNENGDILNLSSKIF